MMILIVIQFVKVSNDTRYVVHALLIIPLIPLSELAPWGNKSRGSNGFTSRLTSRWRRPISLLPGGGDSGEHGQPTVWPVAELLTNGGDPLDEVACRGVLG
ncbi:hypothetical protein DM860_008333 [Cuscuta australis]|uniref:Uncharacterized protein n=1 Tax=Cuscuta australis TaxID=267555 RepID=A0A328D897_9ASTE|nr:hypothetical protein DM860_008333 [Cuscuta australis]